MRLSLTYLVDIIRDTVVMVPLTSYCKPHSIGLEE